MLHQKSRVVKQGKSCVLQCWRACADCSINVLDCVNSGVALEIATSTATLTLKRRWSSSSMVCWRACGWSSVFTQLKTYQTKWPTSNHQWLQQWLEWVQPWWRNTILACNYSKSFNPLFFVQVWEGEKTQLVQHLKCRPIRFSFIWFYCAIIALLGLIWSNKLHQMPNIVCYTLAKDNLEGKVSSILCALFNVEIHPAVMKPWLLQRSGWSLKLHFSFPLFPFKCCVCILLVTLLILLF